MSSLFGSIWTPQSEPYQNHFLPERSVPVSPHTPISPVAPFSREPGGACQRKQYSSYNPFGPHINLDIWNSSSNRSSNSQLSNDSGYCGDMWANGAFVLNNKEKQNVLLSLMGENVNILLSFMFDVVVRFSILLYIFLDVLQVWPLKIKKKKFCTWFCVVNFFRFAFVLNTITCQWKKKKYILDKTWAKHNILNLNNLKKF